jgi:hypothetical protein
LKPNTPASCSAASRPRFCGTAPPQNPTSTEHAPSAALRLIARASGVVVGGTLLSGMSTIVVTPPAAAAAVALAKPSHSVRPGSLTCTWLSTTPGISTSSGANRTSERASTGASGSSSTAEIRPASTTTAPGRGPSGG